MLFMSHKNCYDFYFLTWNINLLTQSRAQTRDRRWVTFKSLLFWQVVWHSPFYGSVGDLTTSMRQPIDGAPQSCCEAGWWGSGTSPQCRLRVMLDKPGFQSHYLGLLLDAWPVEEWGKLYLTPTLHSYQIQDGCLIRMSQNMPALQASYRAEFYFFTSLISWRSIT